MKQKPPKGPGIVCLYFKCFSNHSIASGHHNFIFGNICSAETGKQR